MFTHSINPRQVAGYEASNGRICFAPVNAKKVWIAHFEDAQEFFLATMAVLIWYELYSRRERHPGARVPEVGPRVVEWVLAELVGEHPGEAWRLRRSTHVISRLTAGLAPLHPFVMAKVLALLKNPSTPPVFSGMQAEPCWSCQRDVQLGPDLVCECGADLGTGAQGWDLNLSDEVNRYRASVGA
jgi:hypothetical protein